MFLDITMWQRSLEENVIGAAIGNDHANAYNPYA